MPPVVRRMLGIMRVDDFLETTIQAADPAEDR
jgi:hypothetical protein